MKSVAPVRDAIFENSFPSPLRGEGEGGGGIPLKSNLIRIGTRRSKLALWQANHVTSLLKADDPSVKISLVPIETSRDKLKKLLLSPSPLRGEGGGEGEDRGLKGLFVKELETALLENRVDLAVHSMKDLPMELPAGLVISTILAREDPRDVLLSRDGSTFEKLPSAARVGTSSLRRINQLKRLRPELVYEPLRGNVDTRVRKLKDGTCTAVVLAAAGLKRLGLESEITELLNIIPAAGQGAIGIEIRSDDADLKKRLKPLDDHVTHLSVSAERIFLTIMQGGCRLPVACYVSCEGSSFSISAFVSDLDGSRYLTDRLTVPTLDSVANGARRLAQKLFSQGAREIIDGIRPSS